MASTRARYLHLLSVGGVLAAGVIAVCINVLAHRFYKRWDWTSRGLYTLSAPTLETLHGLAEPVEVMVFLSASDPLRLSVEFMLSAYGAETKLLRPRYVDPDRSPAEFIATQQEYGIIAGKTEDGRVVTDAALVIAQGKNHWFITTDDMVVVDETDRRARPILEQALTEGIRNVLSKEKTLVCFTTGHQEISAEDAGVHGLAELRTRIEKDNYSTRTVNLASFDKNETLDGCRVVIVAGPEVPVSPSAAGRLEKYFLRGGNLLILASPVVDEGKRMRETGLEHLVGVAGIEFGRDFVLERDPEARMPQGFGETFFGAPVPHAVTGGLVVGDVARYRPMISMAQSLKKTKGSTVNALLTTSEHAFSVQDVRPFIEEGRAVEKRQGDTSGPFVLAAAVERPILEGALVKEKHGPRLVVVGSASVAFGQNWREATLIGGRVFTESVLSWLAAKPAIVSVPLKDSHPAGISLTEESLQDVLRYVLLYMPASALGLGTLLLFRRRSTERKSRAAKPRRGAVA
jgi:hypothetical protein